MVWYDMIMNEFSKSYIGYNFAYVAHNKSYVRIN